MEPRLDNCSEKAVGGRNQTLSSYYYLPHHEKDNKNGSGLGDVFNAQRKWPKHSGKVPGRAIYNHLTLLVLRPVRINNAVLELARQV